MPLLVILVRVMATNCVQSKQRPITEEQIEGFYQALEDLIGDKNIAQQEVLALKREVQQLQQNAGQSTIAASVQALCKKYAWAAAPLKAFAFKSVAGPLKALLDMTIG